MKIEGWNQSKIATEARGLIGNPVLSALLSDMEKEATSRIISQSLGDEAALRVAALELKVISNVRTRLLQLGKKDKTNGE